MASAARSHLPCTLPACRLFQGELMLATVLFSAYGGPGRMSPLTLALLQDTGWYEVNMSAAGYMEWGRGAGCNFVKSSCFNYMKTNPEQPYFCSNNKTCEGMSWRTGCAVGCQVACMPAVRVPGLA
jgi:hypothetical protein